MIRPPLTETMLIGQRPPTFDELLKAGPDGSGRRSRHGSRPASATAAGEAVAAAVLGQAGRATVSEHDAESATIVVVHPDPVAGEHLQQMLAVSGLQADLVTEAVAAVPRITHTVPDLVLTLDSGGDIDAIALLGLLRRSPVPVAVLATDPTPAGREEALRSGAVDYLPAELPMDELMVRVWWHVRPEDPHHRYRQNSRGHLGVEIQRACLHPDRGPRCLVARVDLAEREELRADHGEAALRSADRMVTEHLAANRPAGALVAPDDAGGALVFLTDIDQAHPAWELAALCQELTSLPLPDGEVRVTPVIGYHLLTRPTSADAALRRASAACAVGRARCDGRPVDSAECAVTEPVPAVPTPRRHARDGVGWRVMRRAVSSSGFGR